MRSISIQEVFEPGAQHRRVLGKTFYRKLSLENAATSKNAVRAPRPDPDLCGAEDRIGSECYENCFVLEKGLPVGSWVTGRLGILRGE